jgi:hypothetical protein
LRAKWRAANSSGCDSFIGPYNGTVLLESWYK